MYFTIIIKLYIKFNTDFIRCNKKKYFSQYGLHRFILSLCHGEPIPCGLTFAVENPLI